jgi:transposase InsO family protein
MKQDILTVIREAKELGSSEEKACEVLQISVRRVREWKAREDLADGKPGPQKAPHALLEVERRSIRKMARSVEYADDSHRILAVKATDLGLVHASASSFYRQMRMEGMTTDRRGKRRKNGSSQKPDREELTEANKRWCWDISYLRTSLKMVFLFLYVVLDEFSRKVVAWRVSRSLSHLEGMEVVDDAVGCEGLRKEDLEILKLHNDRGIQMRAKGIVKMLKDLGIDQVFSRPRTPNDNPFVESAFSIVKGEPAYPGRFDSEEVAREYFAEYFEGYNMVRLHGGIGYVTPDQKHRGLDVAILAERAKRKEEAREHRLTVNRR